MNQIYTQDRELDEKIEVASNMIAEKCESLKQTQIKITDTLERIRAFFQHDIDDFLKKSPEKMCKVVYLGIFLPYTKLWLNEGTQFKLPVLSDINTIAGLITQSKKTILLGGSKLMSSTYTDLASDDSGWQMRKGNYTIQVKQLLSKKYLQENPEEIWRWRHEIKKSFSGLSSKAITQIADYQIFCAKKSKRFDVATLSVDGLHKIALDEAKKKLSKMNARSISQSFQPEVYELMGNINYRRCSQSCPVNLNPGADHRLSEGVVPKCRRCGENSRPHVLLSDEDFSSADFKIKECMDQIEKADCLIICDINYGTSIELKMIELALRRGITVVEISAHLHIEYGDRVYQIQGNSTEIIPEILKKCKEN